VEIFVHTEFSYKSPGERILKICPHLPKLSNIILSNIRRLSFFGRLCSICMWMWWLCGML